MKTPKTNQVKFGITSLRGFGPKLWNSLPLRKKCPYSELFWFVFSPNAEKYGLE